MFQDPAVRTVGSMAIAASLVLVFNRWILGPSPSAPIAYAYKGPLVVAPLALAQASLNMNKASNSQITACPVAAKTTTTAGHAIATPTDTPACIAASQAFTNALTADDPGQLDAQALSDSLDQGWEPYRTTVADSDRLVLVWLRCPSTAPCYVAPERR